MAYPWPRQLGDSWAWMHSFPKIHYAFWRFSVAFTVNLIRLRKYKKYHIETDFFNIRDSRPGVPTLVTIRSKYHKWDWYFWASFLLNPYRICQKKNFWLIKSLSDYYVMLLIICYMCPVLAGSTPCLFDKSFEG